MTALTSIAELTLLYKLSDMTEPSLATSLLGMGLFKDHEFLKHTGNVCFVLCLLVVVPDYLHGLPGASQLLRVVAQSKSLTS